MNNAKTADKGYVTGYAVSILSTDTMAELNLSFLCGIYSQIHCGRSVSDVGLARNASLLLQMHNKEDKSLRYKKYT